MAQVNEWHCTVVGNNCMHLCRSFVYSHTDTQFIFKQSFAVYRHYSISQLEQST